LRDITRNDRAPNTVVLPNDAYGIFVVSHNDSSLRDLTGVIRILDHSGYEYRTNMQGVGSIQSGSSDNSLFVNFSTIGGKTLSDVYGIVLGNVGDTDPVGVVVADVENIWHQFLVELLDLNENKFSCRNIAFSCVNENHPRLSSLLDNASDAEVASFDYGINEALPSSKGAPLI